MNNNMVLCLIISLIFFNTSFSQVEPDELLLSGRKSFDIGKNTEAIDFLTRYIEIIDTSYEAYYIRGQAYYKLNVKPAAETDLKKATEIYEKLPLAYNILGLISQDNGENQKALLYFTKAIDVEKRFPDAYNNRGFLYGKMGLYRLSLEDLTLAISIDSKNYTYYYNRGYIYVQIDDYERAVDDFTKSVELNSNFGLAYMNRGICYYQLKKYDECISDLEIAIEIDRAFAEEGNKFIRSAKNFLD